MILGPTQISLVENVEKKCGTLPSISVFTFYIVLSDLFLLISTVFVFDVFPSIRLRYYLTAFLLKHDLQAVTSYWAETLWTFWGCPVTHKKKISVLYLFLSGSWDNYSIRTIPIFGISRIFNGVQPPRLKVATLFYLFYRRHLGLATLVALFLYFPFFSLGIDIRSKDPQ